ncbi:MAG: hypothetical protein VR74_19205 [Hyphomonas sp. BRH_c22]|uniref:hypothetical protein n=1 Tax=Hyphomonas sp. BRH_c22 TaxID=1629710 RepID=UPI0005F1974D|nr:hypothetical protein [Hyphomonas sp. BRH_c22]KJS34709.1 MAG: hypothetical protein VR74_19205 [Hyphomonas sp. BRH_c22]
MDPFQMVVIIVLISVGAGVLKNYFKMKENQQADAASDKDVQRMKADIERLKERVHVLEKIVTDNDRHLADEIRKLA